MTNISSRESGADLMGRNDTMQENDAAEKVVYLAQDIQKLLGIGRSRCYTYLEEVYKKQEPFRVIKIGKLFRVPRQSFDNWLNGCD